MRSTSTALLTLLAFGAALWSSASAQSGAGAPRSGQASPGACSLLTEEQVKTLIYRGQRPDAPAEEIPRKGGTACAFNGGQHQLILFSGPSSEADFESTLKAYKHDKEARHPVSGVGDKAYIMYPPPQNQYQRPTAFLVTRVGPHTLGVVIAAQSRQAKAESMQPAAAEVARAAIATLRSGAK